MQIVSQATFQRLKQAHLLHHSTHNRIAYVTNSQLVLRQITLTGKNHCLKVKGNDIIAISLENPNFIVIVYRNGLVEIRKIDNLNQVSISCHIVLGETIPKVRVSGEAAYVLGKSCIETIFLTKEKGRKQVYLSEAKEQPKDLLISSIFEQEIILVQYPSSIALTAEGKNIAEAPFEGVSTFRLLKDPLVLQTESKEFLVLIQARKFLKVFDIFDLEPILEMELVIEEHEEVELKIDPLHQYLIIRYYNPITKQTKRNHLLRVNCDFYKGTAHQPFFLFDIEIGLKQDFILFPTHKELINQIQFFSIDMCFFTAKQIRIATLVVDANFRTKLTHVNYANSSWISHSSWKDFFFESKDPQGKKGELEYQNRADDWQIFLQKFYQQNLQKMKCQGLYKMKGHTDELKYLEYEDALNTLSGSSSFGSLKEVPSKRALPYGRRPYEQGDYISSEGEDWKSKHEEKQLQNASFDSDESQRDQYLRKIEEQVLQVMNPIDNKAQEIAQHFDRIENVHNRKLRNMEKNIRRHRKQVQNIDKNIQKWCFEQFQTFGLELKDSLKEFGSMVGRLEIVEVRTVRKLKKHYRDHLQMQLEKCTQKLQDSEKKLHQIQQLAQRQSKKKLY